MAIKRNKPAVTITLAKSVLERLDKEAEELGIDRSGMVAVCINQYFRSNDALQAIQQASDLMEQATLLRDSAQLTFSQVQNND